MKIEQHLESITESFDVIEEYIQKGLLLKRQKTIGFHCSSASIDLFEIYLHNLNLLTLSSQLKHNWFGSEKKINEKIPFDFPEKKNIIPILVEIELKRNLLCYGRKQPESIIESDIFLLRKLKNILKQLGVDYE